MSNFPEEGWVCVHPYTFDHYVAKIPTGTIEYGPRKGEPTFDWSALCHAHGWFRGPGLREKPLDFKPTCKKCEKLLAELLEARKEAAQHMEDGAT